MTEGGKQTGRAVTAGQKVKKSKGGRVAAKGVEKRTHADILRARAARNRASAERSRQKKKDDYNNIVARSNELEKENFELKEKVEELRRVAVEIELMAGGVPAGYSGPPGPSGPAPHSGAPGQSRTSCGVLD